MAKSKKKPTFKNDGYIVEGGFRIRKFERKSGTRYQVDLGRSTGKYIRKTFRLLDNARTYARQKRRERNARGYQAHQLTDRMRMDAMDATSILKDSDADLKTAARYYVKHHPTAQTSKATVNYLAGVYSENMRDRLERGDLRPASVTSALSRVNRFCDDMGRTRAQELTGEDVDEWMDAQGFKPMNRQNYKRNLSVFFNWLAGKGYIDKNPVTQCRRERLPSRMPVIWTPSQTRNVFRAAKSMDRPERNSFISYMAVLFFSGLRPLEGLRLKWEQINMELGEIHVLPETSKTRRGRIVSIEPNLREWLMECRATKGRVFPHKKRFMRQCRKDVIDAAEGVERWLPDGARHSYATYHLARNGNIDETVLQLGHRNPKMLFEHYWGLAQNRKKQAERYFNITPKSLRTTITNISQAGA